MCSLFCFWRIQAGLDLCYFSIFTYWGISILFSFSDYNCYELIEATRNDEAVSIFTGRSYLNLLTSE